jgi:soluble lytic murein transglycosylase-like protein
MAKQNEQLNLKRKSPTWPWMLLLGGAAMSIAATQKDPASAENPKTEPVAAVAAAPAVKIPASLSSKYDALFIEEGGEHGVSPVLLAAVAKQESGFNPNAGSKAGAGGLMQFMPGTAASYGIDRWNPHQAIDGAARMYRDLLARYDGNVDLALAGYNAGTGAVDQYNGVPPYKETRQYVRSIKAMLAGAS